METRLHIAVISNIIFEPHFLPLAKQYFGKNTAISPIPFGEHIEVECQTQVTSADFIVVWLNLESLYPELYFTETQHVLDGFVALCKKLYADLTSVSKAKFYGFCLRIMPYRSLWQSVMCTMISLTS